MLDAHTGAAIYALQFSVAAGPAAGLRLSDLPPALSAGQAAALTLAAVDAYGNTATDYIGAAYFASSDPAAQLPSAYAFSRADNGIHTFIDGVAFKTAGQQLVTAVDLTSTGVTAASRAVAVSASQVQLLRLTGPTSTQAGSPCTYAVAAHDTYDNVVTGYAGTVTWTGSDPNARWPQTYTFQNADSGVHVFSDAVTLRTAGFQYVSVTDTAARISGRQSNITVDAAPAQALAVSGNTTTIAGTAYDFTLRAVDPFGNTATSYTGTVHFSSADGGATFPADSVFTICGAGCKPCHRHFYYRGHAVTYRNRHGHRRD